MSVINILDQQTANLIAAGEVVDRPAAVAKELLENAIDAGGTIITIEIKNGGSTLIRVTDNGKGMSPEDVKNCVLRHATSKIKTPRDLEGISTLGFRGEALAAISAVSRFQVISKEPDAHFGTCMSMEGEVTLSFDETGCPDGTTITVRDIFFNVPARRKFLKKDATETAYITQYVERIAISHPEISIKFIVDGRIKFSTSGNGVSKDAIYSVFGRELVDSLMPISRTTDKISINGFVSIPEQSRINRNYQIVYVNNRLVRSKIVSYAIEDAYKSYIMTDRYPAFVVFIDINPYLVDINVHPTKLEVRFVDDMLVRETVYFAVKNELEKKLNPIKEDFVKLSQETFEKHQFKNAFVPLEKQEAPEQQEIQEVRPSHNPHVVSQMTNKADIFAFAEMKPIKDNQTTELKFSDSGNVNNLRNDAPSFSGKVENVEDFSTAEEIVEPTVSVAKFVKYVGVAFDTYVIAEYEGSMYIIDKHAAHERILYEALKNKKSSVGVQSIIDTRVLNLTPSQFEAVVDSLDEIRKCGFDVEIFGESSIALRGVPTEFSALDVSENEKILSEMINDISIGKSARLTKEEIFDKSLYTVACKAATKAGYKDDEQSYIWLINKLFEMDNVFCCPHGRPVIVKYTKAQIEKMFYRT